MASEHGQATIEWTGLVLLTSAAMAALVAVAVRVDHRGLPASITHAITCAARGGCAARSPPALGRRQEPRRTPAGWPVPRRGRASPSRPAPPARPGVPPARAAAAFHALRGLADVAKRAWIVCLGYRRYRYELEHPRVPTQAMPLAEALAIANECVNPFGFLADDR